MKIETLEVAGIMPAIIAMRNPLNSWDKSDSKYADYVFDYVYRDGKAAEVKVCEREFTIGEKDMELAHRLIISGPEHRKFLRQIFVSVDMTMPLYVWKEFDTYKIGTVANSCSTMHKLASTPITMDCFETGDYRPDIVDVSGWIKLLEDMRQAYLATKNKAIWKELIRWLPESWLQKRTITMNYEVIRNIVRQRQGHKLSEWQAFIDWAHTLPYADELIFYGQKGETE